MFLVHSRRPSGPPRRPQPPMEITAPVGLGQPPTSIQAPIQVQSIILTGLVVPRVVEKVGKIGFEKCVPFECKLRPESRKPDG